MGGRRVCVRANIVSIQDSEDFMTLQRAALLAAIGVLLRGLHYWIANLIPSWNSSGSLEQATLLMVAVVDPLIWTVYFVTVWRGIPNRIAALLAAVLGLAEVAFAGRGQYELFSWTASHSLAFIFGGVVPVLCWTLYLSGRRIGLWYLLLYCLSQVALFIYQTGSSASLIQEFWREEPWQLLIAPVIWIVYWVTQTLFVRAAQKA
jgi:hypothetical protein